MTLAKLVKQKSYTVLGLDASTNSLAFCLFANGYPVKWGKIEFEGADIFEKLVDAKIKVHAMLDYLKSDYIAMEGAVLVRSPDAVIKLSYVYGAVLAELMTTGSKVTTISPTAWQAKIGNKNPTKAEKDQLKKEFPGYADSWYKNKMRNIRKQRTATWAKSSFNIDVEDFDVADAIGIAYYASEVLTSR
jgi:Holliday junction resolvasome RuvABC endonuclease subunit